MSRYIEVEDVANAIYHHFPSVRTMADARGVIEETPSIDIVRCKECKYAEVYDGYYTQVCCENGVIGGHGELWNPDDFCSYGERKESE